MELILILGVSTKSHSLLGILSIVFLVFFLFHNFFCFGFDSCPSFSHCLSFASLFVLPFFRFFGFCTHKDAGCSELATFLFL
jgi:hypothetical protein